MIEELLIKRCRERDETAFEQLLKLYRRRLFSYLIKLTGDKNTAEDLFQETLIKLWQNFPVYNEQNKFGSWLFSIAHNAAMDYFRKNKLRNSVMNCGELPEQNNDITPHSEYLANELKAMVDAAIEVLSEKQREVFILRQYSDLTFKEISEITNEPLNTVLGHMHYAVNKIKKTLRKNYAT